MFGGLQFVIKGGVSAGADGTRTRVVTTVDLDSCLDPRGALTDQKAWASSDEACSVTKALDDALAGREQASAGVVVELMDADDEDGLSARVVNTTGGCDPYTLLPQIATMPVLARFNTSDTARDVLLAHDFAGGLRLITLVAGGPRDGRVAPSMLAAAFPGEAHVALAAGKSYTYTDVQVGGVSQSAESLAAMSGVHRTALREAQHTQLLAAAKQCMYAEWLGGVLTMRKCDAVTSWPQLEVSLHALEAVVVSEQSGGRVTLQTCCARTQQAEALEAQGRHMEAAKLYKQNLDDDIRNPGVVLTPPLMWSYYGIALRKAGRSVEAAAAYEAGLRALAGHVSPDTPEWREHNRILLCCRLITMHSFSGNEAGRNAAISRLFRDQFALLGGFNAEPVVFRNLPQGLVEIYELTASRSRRMWRTLHGPDPLRRREHAGLELFRIEEVPIPAALSGKPLNLGSISALPIPKGISIGNAAVDPKLRRGPIPIATLPPAACGVCGSAPAKRCAACMGPAYCGKACQLSDWAMHKKDCKAAQRKAKAAAAEGGSST